MVLEAPNTEQRFRILKFAIIIWAAVITVRLFYFSVINQEAAFKKMETESLETGRIVALRGRILTHDGEVLASTRRVSHLCMSTDIESSQLNSLVVILDKELKIMRRQVMIKLANSGNKDYIVLKSGLTPEEIVHFSRLFNRNKTLFIKMELKRDYHTESSRLGRVVKEDGRLVGVSGFEKKYNAVLTGQDFVYELMVDRQNNVLGKTFNEISAHIPGQDVHLTKEEWP